MSDIDYEKLAGMVVAKLGEKNRPERDEEFLDRLVDKIVEHRSPCHNLDDDEVDSIKTFIAKEKKLAKGRFLITWGIILYVLKSLYDLAIINIHWGGK